MNGIPANLDWRDTGKRAPCDCVPLELARANDVARRFVRVRNGRMEVATA